jgi:hypothetical protein
MAIGLLMEFPVMGQEQYDAVMEELNLGGRMPSGGISHAAGPAEDGWRVVDVWQSQEAFDVFFRDEAAPSDAERWYRTSSGPNLPGTPLLSLPSRRRREAARSGVQRF